MEAATWTAIGLLAATSLSTMDASFDRVNARLEDLTARVDTHLGRHAS